MSRCLHWPTDAAGNKGVTRVDKPEDLKPALNKAMLYSITGHIIVEEFIEQKPNKGHWAEIILHADKEGFFDHIEICEEKTASIIEEDLWVSPGDQCFKEANNAIGTLVMQFQTSEKLENAITHLRNWMKIVVN